MGQRINGWIPYLFMNVITIATLVLLHFGFSALKTVAIVLPICGVFALVMIAVSPGPRTKDFVEGLKNRFR